MGDSEYTDAQAQAEIEQATKQNKTMIEMAAGLVIAHIILFTICTLSILSIL